MFIQTNPDWAGLHIGSSEFLMGPEGCLTCDQAWAMQMAGYRIYPSTLCTNSPLYTPDGLWKWYEMGKVYPQYHIHLDASGHYQFVQVTATWGGRRYQHWLLRVDGTYYDSIDGSASPTLKSNYVLTGRIYSADIDPAPVVEAPKVFTVTITDGVNIRTPDNRTNGPIGSLKKGTVVRCIESRLGERIDDQPWWLKLEDKVKGYDAYIWAGATDFDEHNITFVN